MKEELIPALVLQLNTSNYAKYTKLLQFLRRTIRRIGISP